MRWRVFLVVWAFVLGATTLANAGQVAPHRWAVCGEWRQVTTPETFAFPSDLAVVSPKEAWLAGYAGDVRGLPVVLHWMGMRWESEVFPTHVAAVDEQVAGFAVVSSDDVWAVGSWRASSRSHPLVAHWDGTVWSIVKTGMPSLLGGLNSIAVVPGSEQMVAVGSTAGTSAYGMAIGKTLVLRFDGGRWYRVPSPSPGRASQFKDVVVVDGRIWAVGSTEDRGGVTRTLAARYLDGRWRTFAGRRGSLQAVDAADARHVWVVGPGKDVAPQRAFIQRWNGIAWTTVRLLGGGTALQDIVVASPNDVWAVGYRGGMYDSARPLIMRRNGSTWRGAEAPDVRGPFYAVDGTPHDLWALSWRVQLGADGPPQLDTFHRC